MNTLRIFDPGDDEPAPVPPPAPAATAPPSLLDTIRIPTPPRIPKPKCRCGCGKAAQWPRDGKPLFYSRKCGYLMACKMFNRKPR